MQENKKNSAIEKTENIANNTNEETNTQNEILREQKAEEQAKNQEEKIAFKMRRQEEYKKLRFLKREERLKRQEQLRHETKKERLDRILKEKEERLALKRQKLSNEKQRQIDKIKERQDRRNAKLIDRKDRRKNRRGIGGWIAAVISLGCVSIIATSLLLLTLFTPIDDYMTYDTTSQRNFYDLVECVDNLDVNLSKLIVSNDSEEQQKLLGEIRVQSNLATENLSMLALQDENKYNTIKFINQISDFTKMLNEKLIEGEKLTASDKQTLYDMHEINAYLKGELNALTDSLDENFNFKTLHEGKEDNLVISKFIELESNVVTYPTLIYDGAFSDGTINDEAKGLKGEKEVTKQQAEDILKQSFASYNLKEISLIGENVGTVIETYDFEAYTSDDTRFDASISKMGGKIISFNHYKDCSSSAYSVKDCLDIAEKFLQNIGFKNLKAVWTGESEYTLTFNFASIIDGVICYSDLVKVNVCRERGEVSGMEAKSYYLNHTNRNFENASISLQEATSKVSSEIEINTSRLAIIPKGYKKETLAYEFSGTRNDETYYVYIDAYTGKEVNIFKVVKTTEGILLM